MYYPLCLTLNALDVSDIFVYKGIFFLLWFLFELIINESTA